MKKLACLLILLVPSAIFAQETLNIISYGAVADSTVLSTGSIQRAIDSCASKGGGRVLVPAGIFLTGSLFLKSNVDLYLSAGAVLLGSPSVKDYPGIGMKTEDRDNALVVAIDAVNISISGRGKIDGNGRRYIDTASHSFVDFDRKYIRQGDSFMRGGHFPDGPRAMKDRPGVLILLIRCRDVSLKDFNIADAPNWCLHLAGCQFVNIRGLNILNSLLVPNADGIDASNCRFVTISDCNIVAGDDGIAISPCAEGFCTGPSENYTVTNCNIVSRSAGIRVGYGHYDILNLLFQNITITESNRGIGLFVRAQQNIRNVRFSNIYIQTRLLDGTWWGAAEPIHLSVVPGLAKETVLGEISDVHFDHVRAESENGIVVFAEKPGHIREIGFRDISLRISASEMSARSGGNFDFRPVYQPHLAIFRHDIPAIFIGMASDIGLHDITVRWAKGLPSYFTHAVWAEDVQRFSLSDLRGAGAPYASNTNDVKNVKNVKAVKDAGGNKPVFLLRTTSGQPKTF